MRCLATSGPRQAFLYGTWRELFRIWMDDGVLEHVPAAIIGYFDGSSVARASLFPPSNETSKSGSKPEWPLRTGLLGLEWSNRPSEAIPKGRYAAAASGGFLSFERMAPPTFKDTPDSPLPNAGSMWQRPCGRDHVAETCLEPHTDVSTSQWIITNQWMTDIYPSYTRVLRYSWIQNLTWRSMTVHISMVLFGGVYNEFLQLRHHLNLLIAVIL